MLLAVQQDLREVCALKGEFRYRIKYTKENPVRYISHLDFVRVVNRAVRRSGLAVTYTEGFNPHPVFKVAMPISVGVTSEYELMDMDFDSFTEPEIIENSFNSVMPDGIRITDVRLINSDFIDFNKINKARYRVCVELKSDKTPDIESFLRKDDIIVLKKSKSKEKQVNIRQDIHHLSIESKNTKYVSFIIEATAGNNNNVKPELVISAMEKYIEGFNVEFLQVHRLKMMADSGELI